MAMASFQLVPQATFDAHTHNYRKATRIGADSDDKWASPTWVDIADNADTHVKEAVDLEAVGITVATASTSTPI